MQISFEATEDCPDLSSAAKLAQSVLVKVVICSRNVLPLAGASLSLQGSSLFRLILSVSCRNFRYLYPVCFAVWNINDHLEGKGVSLSKISVLAPWHLLLLSLALCDCSLWHGQHVHAGPIRVRGGQICWTPPPLNVQVLQVLSSV